MSYWGTLIAVEGIDGAGTTTFATKLYERISEVYERVVLTHEPTEGLLGLIARSILQREVSEKYERSDLLAYLFTADRIYHFYEKEIAGIKGGILALLRNGFVVITDRYKYSTVVYQSLARRGSDDLPLEFLMEMNSVIPPPHLLVLLEVSPERALERISARESLSIDERLHRLKLLSERFEQAVKLVEKEGEGLWRTKVPDADNFMPKGYPKILRIRNEEPEDLEKGLRKVMEVLKERLNLA